MTVRILKNVAKNSNLKLAENYNLSIFLSFFVLRSIFFQYGTHSENILTVNNELGQTV